MPPYGNQPQQLTYRVEIEQSSLSEAAQQIQLAVGSALTSAVAGISGVASQLHGTAASAMSPGRGHLSFLESQRSVLTQAPAAGGGGGGLAQAVAVKMGLVEPGFSQTHAGMQLAAQNVLKEARLSAMETMSRVGGVASTALGIGSVAATVFGATALASGLGAVALPLDAALIGIDRAAEREQLRSSLYRYGVGSARAITRDIEDLAATTKGASFGEVANVARSTLTALGSETVRGSEVREVLRDSVQSWRTAGRTLGVDKDVALDLVNEFARMGIRPGSATDQTLSRAGSVADILGVTSTGLANAMIQVQQQSMTLGYNALTAGNQFTIQSGMIAEAMRSGMMNKQTLTMAAGFYGATADQNLAATTAWQGSMRSLNESGFGQVMALGAARGGGSDPMSLMAAAGGASVREILTARTTSRQNFDAGRMNELLGQTVSTYLGGLGISDPTQDEMAAAMQNFGLDAGAARIAAVNFMNPNIAAREQRMSQRRRGAASAELARTPWWAARVAENVTTGFGDMVEYWWNGQDPRGDGAGTGALMTGGTAWAVDKAFGLGGWVEKSRGEEAGAIYGGIRGWGRALYNSASAATEPLSEATQWLYESLGGDVGRFESSFSSATITKSEARALGSRGMQQIRVAVDEAERMARKLDPTHTPTMGALLKGSEFDRQKLQDAAYGRLGGSSRMLEELRQGVQDKTGVEMSTDLAMGLVTDEVVYRSKVSEAKTEEERKQLLANRIEAIQTMPGMEKISAAQAEKLSTMAAASGLSKAYTAEEVQKLRRGETATGAMNAISEVLSSDQAKAEFVRTHFRDPQSTAAKEFMALKGTASYGDVARVFDKASTKDYQREFVDKIAASKMGATDAAAQALVEQGAPMDVDTKRKKSDQAAISAMVDDKDDKALARQVAGLVYRLNSKEPLLVEVVNK